jgi:hypothetical protein
LYNQWIEWRVAKMTAIIQQLITAAKEVKPTLKVIPTYPVDSESGFVAGTRTNQGMDFEAIAKMNKNLAIEVYPWTPILPDIGSKDFSVYVENLAFISSLRKLGIDFTMNHWILEDEAEYNRAKAIAEAVDITDIYTMLGYPDRYQSIREIRLGLGT